MTNLDLKKLAKHNKYINPNKIEEVYQYLDKVGSLVVKNKYDIGLPTKTNSIQTETFFCNSPLANRR